MVLCTMLNSYVPSEPKYTLIGRFAAAINPDARALATE